MDASIARHETPNDFDDLIEIVQLCREIEFVSMKFYREVSKKAGSKELASFWRNASKEELSHLKFWDQALSIAKRGALPQIFDNPAEVKSELVSVAGKAFELLSELPHCGKSLKSMMTMAFRLEFYCLHRALAPIFGLMGDASPCASYGSHIQSFIDMYRRHCDKASPELQLLGETIQRLWMDNFLLSRQCYFDELSGLLNRRGLYNSARPLISLAKRRCNPVSALVVDIDRFKELNDRHGHDAGDLALREIAKVLKKVVRDSDILARYGGDEFVVFCPELSPGSTKAVAEKVLAAIRSSSFGEFRVTVSIGAVEGAPSTHSSPEEELSRLVREADRLLYEAKQSGRDRVAWKRLD